MEWRGGKATGSFLLWFLSPQPRRLGLKESENFWRKSWRGCPLWWPIALKRCLVARKIGSKTQGITTSIARKKKKKKTI